MKTVEEMQRLLAAELSLPARLAYTALLLVSLSVAGAVGSLLLTEPALPRRTQIAFALIVGIGLSWVAYAVWVLTRRRVLLAGHRIIAARMAIVFSTVFVIASVTIAQTSAGRAAYGAVGVGVVMLAIAIAVLINARRRFAELLDRRRVLERELAAR